MKKIKFATPINGDWQSDKIEISFVTIKKNYIRVKKSEYVNLKLN